MNVADMAAQRLSGIIRDLLGLERDEVSPAAALSDLGFSSITLAQFAQRIERELGVALEPVVFLECETLARLAAHLAERMPHPVAPAPAPLAAGAPAARDTLAEVAALVARATGFAPDEIDPEQGLGEYGFDSIKLGSLARGIAETFGVELEPVAFLENDTVGALARHLAGRGAAGQPPTSPAASVPPLRGRLRPGSRVAVVGAGPGGIATAKCLLEEGYEPVLLERTHLLGGTYVFREDFVGGPYESLTMQSSKYSFFYSDFPPPEGADVFPTVEQVNAYLRSYMARFGIDRHLRLGHEVRDISRQGDRWRVETSAGGETRVFDVDGVVLCTGSYWIPKKPEIEGLDRFRGVSITSDCYRNNDRFVGKRVLVVGGGVSGCDVASEAADVARSVLFATRRKTWILPSMVGYVPSDMTASFAGRVQNGRVAEDEFRARLSRALPGYMRDYEKSGLLPTGVHNNAIGTNDDVVGKVATGKIVLAGEVVRFDETRVYLGDGSSHELDVVVFCTGYEEMPVPVSPRLGPADFYRYVFHPDEPTLARMSVPLVLSRQSVVLASALPFLELVARWYCGVMAGRDALPDAEGRHAWVRERREKDDHPYIFDGWLESLKLALEVGAFPRPEEDWARYWDMINLPPLSAVFRVTGPHAWDGAEEELRRLRKRIFLGRGPDQNRDIRLGVLKGLGEAALLDMHRRGMLGRADVDEALAFGGPALTPYLADLATGQWPGYARPAEAGTRVEPVPAAARAQVLEAAPAPTAAAAEPIAVIGMATRVPGADGLAGFWKLLSTQRSSIGTVPASRWRWEDHDGDAAAGRATDCHHGAFLEGLEMFDARRFGLSEEEATYLDPQSRLLFETCHELVETAGYGRDFLKGRRVAVMVGVQRQEFMAQVTERLRLFSPAVENGSFQGFMVNRLAHHFDWRGPTFAVNSACASSSVAIHLAAQALRSGEADVAVAGGVNVVMSPLSLIAQRAQGGLTARGEVRSFDREADGIVIGEGCGLLLLKPLSRARADGDHVYGVLLGSAVGNSGRSLHQLAPNPEGHARVMREALSRAGLTSDDLDYVEGQGAATGISDQAELKAYHTVFAGGAAPPRLTNLKANIGHAETASGAVAAVKTLLSMSKGWVPGVANVRRLSWTPADGPPLEVVTSNEPWRQKRADRRVASVHNFGAGGVQAHMVLARAAAEPGPAPASSGPRLCVFSAQGEEQLVAYLHRFLGFLRDRELELHGVARPELADVAHTLGARRRHHPVRFAVVADGLDALEELLASVLAAEAPAVAGRVVSAGNAADAALAERGRAWAAGTGELPETAGRVVPLPASVFARKRLWPFDGAAAAPQDPAAPAAAPACPAVPDAETVLEAVRSAASGVLGVEAALLDPDETLGYLGFDSATLKLFAAQLALAFGVELEPVAVFEHPTLRRLAGHLAERGALRPAPAPRAAPASAVPAGGVPAGAVAIVGVSVRLPGAGNKEEFWRNQRAARNCIVEVPPERWDWRDVYGDPHREPGKTRARWGGFIDGIDRFPAGFFGISPYEAELMDPQHRLFLKATWEAVWDAGYDPRSLAGRSVGVFAGVQFQEYQQLLGEAGLVNAQACTGNAHTMLPNRVSFLLDVHGPSEAIDTACSSSLVAVHNAVRAIRSGDCEMAVAGGVNLMLVPDVHIMGSQLGVLSPTGQCRTFDAGADGYVRGEGVGVLLLKPLEAALTDGDHVYGVIRGTAVNHGGKASSLTAPNSRAQAQLVSRAVRDAGVPVNAITYVEMHGTGTELGDPIEVEGVKSAFRMLREEQGAAPTPCAMGSVKTSIGHLEAAAGVAGLVNVLMAMADGTLPGLANFERQNPYIRMEDGFFLQTRAGPWPRVDGAPRCAVVNSFGFGGANASVVVEEHPSAARPAAPAGEVVAPLAAFDEAALAAHAGALAAAVGEMARSGAADAALLRDVAFTLRERRDPGSARALVRAPRSGELRAALEALASGAASNAVATSRSGGAGWPEYALRWLDEGAVEWPALSGARRVSLPPSPWPDQSCWYRPFPPALRGAAAAEPAAETPAAPAQVEDGVFHLRPEWRGAPLAPAATGRFHDSPLVIVAQDKVRAAALADEVGARAPGARVRVAVPGAGGELPALAGIDEASVRAWVAELRSAGTAPEAVVVLPPAAPEEEDAAVELVFALGRGLMESFFNRGVDVFLAAPDEFGRRPRLDGLAAFARSSYLENPRHRLHLVYPQAGAGESAALRRVAAEALAVPPQRPQVLAYAPERRARGLAPVAPAPRPEGAGAWFRRGGVYLVPGGAGELGLRLLPPVLAEHAATVVLLGRSPLDGEVRRRVEALGAAAGEGRVEYRQCDVSDLAQVQRAVDEVVARYGAVHGVVNLVTEHRDAFVFNKSWADFRHVARSKVDGSEALDRATRDLPLDFFVLFSSQAALGMAGGSDYAYGCGFQNAFAAWRSAEVAARRRSGRTVALAWSRWEWDKYVTEEFDRWLVELGYGFFDVETGIRHWRAALAGSDDELFVLRGNRDVVLGRFDLEAGMFVARRAPAAAAQAEAPTDPSPSADELLTSLTDEQVLALAAEWLPGGPSAPAPAPQPAAGGMSPEVAEVAARVASILEELLKTRGVSPDARFQELGVDSILALGLVSAVEDAFDVEVAPRWFFQYPTVAELAEQIAARRGAGTAPPAPAPPPGVGGQAAALEAAILDVVRTQLKNADIGRDDPFSQLGLDSIMAVRLVTRLEDITGAEIPPRWIFEHPTAAALADRLARTPAALA